MTRKEKWEVQKQFRKATVGVRFRLACEILAKQLKINDPKLSQDVAFKRARKLVKIDWKQVKKEL